MRARDSIFRYIDWPVIGLFIVLVLLGWLNIYAATFNEAYESIFDTSQSSGKQLLWIGTACVLAIVILFLDAKLFDSFAYVIYGVALLLLIGVLIVGSEIKGAKSWYVIGSFSLQPSEFAKYATALAITKFLSSTNTKFQQLKTKIRAFAIIFTPAALIMLQPDAGSTLIFLSFIFVLYREGLSGNILLLGLTAVTFFILALLLKSTYVTLPFDIKMSGKLVFMGVLTGLALGLYALLRKQKRVWILIFVGWICAIGYIASVDYVFDNVLSDHQRNRINELLGIVSDPTGAGYNVHQSKIAIGSGGLTGKGYLQGTQTKYDFVPEQSTDFIFCTVGEEWGFLGSLVVIALFLALMIRIIYIAERQRSHFSRIFGYCTASILFFHFAINLGMTIGLAPVIGIPLPFFSYGGSSLWAFTILLFTFIKMDSERKHVLR